MFRRNLLEFQPAFLVYPCLIQNQLLTAVFRRTRSFRVPIITRSLCYGITADTFISGLIFFETVAPINAEWKNKTKKYCLILYDVGLIDTQSVTRMHTIENCDICS